MPETWVIDQYAGIYNFYKDNNNTLAGNIALQVPESTTSSALATASQSNSFVNAYDVVNSSAIRNKVATTLHNSPRMAFTSSMSSFGRAVRLAGVVTPDVDLTVHVEFPDGSSAIYKFDWNTKKWVYEKKTAVDSHGNSIPETREDYVNGGSGYSEFSFDSPGGNPNDINDFIFRARNAGIPITDGRKAKIVCGTADGNLQCFRL